jgi:quercetin dioxygenase-like cupin family protein
MNDFKQIFPLGGKNDAYAQYFLFCTAGKGWYQEEGKSARPLIPGDVINIPAGVKHWHGATKDSWFAHVALSVPVEGATTEWLNPITDEEYNKL